MVVRAPGGRWVSTLIIKSGNVHTSNSNHEFKFVQAIPCAMHRIIHMILEPWK
eukprot:COSAG02_NODE_7671_length_2901_cov_2.527123_6_plen_53_part_00